MTDELRIDSRSDWTLGTLTRDMSAHCEIQILSATHCARLQDGLAKWLTSAANWAEWKTLKLQLTRYSHSFAQLSFFFITTSARCSTSLRDRSHASLFLFETCPSCGSRRSRESSNSMWFSERKQKRLNKKKAVYEATRADGARHGRELLRNLNFIIIKWEQFGGDVNWPSNNFDFNARDLAIWIKFTSTFYIPEISTSLHERFLTT